MKNVSLHIIQAVDKNNYVLPTWILNLYEKSEIRAYLQEKKKQLWDICS